MKTCGCPECESTGLTLAGAAARNPALPLIAAAVLFGLAFLLRSLPGAVLYCADEILFIVAFLLPGAGTILQALRTLGQGRLFNENFLMSLASLGALAIGELPEAAAIMILFNLGELLESRSVSRARRSIAALMETKPDLANLVMAGGNVEQVAPETVRPGEEVIVRPGEKVALDGEVIFGSSSVNNAALTGEAVPQPVLVGDPVLAGAINGAGLLRLRVSRPFGESSLARIYRLVEQSAAQKAPTERFMTTFARYYTPAVVAGALLLAFIPPLVIPGAAFRVWLYRALVFLVISCPCALVISIPLGYLGGIGSASKQGILIKGANYLEALRRLKVVVFDKTGTLTEGLFQVERVIPAPGLSRSELLYWAAHAEAHSSHPLARSIREAYPGAILSGEIGSCESLEGLGIRAAVRGREVLAGSLRLLQREGTVGLSAAPPGGSVYLALEGRYAGALMMGERLRPEAAAAVRELKKLGVRRTVILSGDGAAAAGKVARKAGVDLAHSSLLPEEKVAHLETLLSEAGALGGKLAYVGDGINDAPALSRAHLGIAMGGAGADAAIEAADVVIMDDQLLRVAAAVRIGRFTHRIVWQNIILALGVKGLFLVAGALGAVPVWAALFADVGVALLAIANAARAFWPGRQGGPGPVKNYLMVEPD